MRQRKSLYERLQAQVEQGQYDRLLTQESDKDNYDRRKSRRQLYNAFVWRCLNLTDSPHRKATRDQFAEVFRGAVSGGLLAVARRWLELKGPAGAADRQGDY